MSDYANLNEIGIEDLGRIRNPWEREICLKAQETAIRREFADRLATADPQLLARSYFALGNVMALRQEYSQAADNYNNALSQVTDFPAALQNLQVVYERMGKHREAAELVARQLEFRPATPRLLSEMAADTVKLGDESKALELLNRALDLDPQYAPALIVASTIYGNRNDIARAVEFSRKAVAADPHDARGYANLAVAFYKKGDLDSAQAVINRGLLAIPGDARLIGVRRALAAAGGTPNLPAAQNPEAGDALLGK